MNSKLIAIIAVVAMCGAALVGVGYAYSATVTTSGSSIATDVDYVSIVPDSTSKGKVTLTDIKVDYSYTSDGTTGTYSVVSVDSDVSTVTLTIDAKSVTTDGLTLTIELTDLVDKLPSGTKLKVTYGGAEVELTGNKIVKEYTANTIPSTVELTFGIVKDTSAVSISPAITQTGLTFGITYSLEKTPSSE